MRKSNYILFFLPAVSLPLILIVVVYNIVSGKPLENNLVRLFLINFPFCMAAGLMDWAIISYTYGKLRKLNEAMKILVDLCLTTAVCVLVTAVLNYALSGHEGMETALQIVP